MRTVNCPMQIVRNARDIDCLLQAFTGLSGRKLAQSTTLTQGLYHIQSVSRLETCWNYLSIPNCTIGDTVDLYYEDDGSGRQQFDIVPLSGKAPHDSIICTTHSVPALVALVPALCLPTNLAASRYPLQISMSVAQLSTRSQ